MKDELLKLSIENSIIENSIVKTAIELGAKLWVKNTHIRLYINEKKVMEFIGADCTYYGTGNLSSAYFNGEKISNAKVRKMKKPAYIDLVKGVLVFFNKTEIGLDKADFTDINTFF